MKKELSIRLSLLGRVKLFVAGWADAYANLFSLYLGEKVSIYTAVTRAKTMAVLVGREDALSRMVENDRETVRYTGLRDMLQSAGESHA